MAIRNSLNVTTRISPDLSILIENRVNDSVLDEPITLGVIRDFIVGLSSTAFSETEHMHHFDNSESLLDEVEALIEEFDETALAIDFVRNVASEPLSRVIETVMNDENREAPPTLGAVKEALTLGLSASLIGTGALDEDEDDSLLTEIEALIDHHGADALAEEFLCYE